LNAPPFGGKYLDIEQPECRLTLFRVVNGIRILMRNALRGRRWMRLLGGVSRAYMQEAGDSGRGPLVTCFLEVSSNVSQHFFIIWFTQYRETKALSDLG
jgi:hypothetical protein